MISESAVVSLVERLVDAWNRGDAEGFAAHFTPDADYVTGSGAGIRGSRAIAGLLADGAHPLRVAISGSVSIRSTETTATATFRWETLPEIEPVRRGVVSCTVVRHGSELRVERLLNADDATDEA